MKNKTITRAKDMIKPYLKIITTKIDKTKYLQNNQVMEEAA